jgi:uncharacterized protein YqgV (UPF0045/DUF77 family)
MGRDFEVRVEFTVYPFREGETPPAHVEAAIQEIRKAGLDVVIGTLGQVVTGEAGIVFDALRSAEAAALSAGATRMVFSIEVEGTKEKASPG